MKKITWVPLGQMNVASSRIRAYQIADALRRHYSVTSYFAGSPIDGIPPIS